MLDQKATVTITHQLADTKGKPLPYPKTSVVLAGELLPSTPLEHEVLVALLSDKNPPDVDVEFTNTNNVLGYKVTIAHEDDVLAAGAAAHKLNQDAAAAGLSVADYQAKVAAVEKARIEAEEKAKAEAEPKAKAEKK